MNLYLIIWVKCEKMPKISGLIFSADPIKETLATAKHLLEFTDEVVIVCSAVFLPLAHASIRDIRLLC